MARRKKGKKRARRRSYKKKARRSGPKAMPLGSTVGAIAYGAPIVLKAYADFKANNLKALPQDMLYEAFGYNLAGKELYLPKTTQVVTPLIGGMIISAAPRLPIVKLVAKPVNRELKKLTKGKVSL